MYLGTLPPEQNWGLLDRKKGRRPAAESATSCWMGILAKDALPGKPPRPFSSTSSDPKTDLSRADNVCFFCRVGGFQGHQKLGRRKGGILTTHDLHMLISEFSPVLEGPAQNCEGGECRARGTGEPHAGKG